MCEVWKKKNLTDEKETIYSNWDKPQSEVEKVIEEEPTE